MSKKHKKKKPQSNSFTHSAVEQEVVTEEETSLSSSAEDTVPEERAAIPIDSDALDADVRPVEESEIAPSSDTDYPAEESGDVPSPDADFRTEESGAVPSFDAEGVLSALQEDSPQEIDNRLMQEEESAVVEDNVPVAEPVPPPSFATEEEGAVADPVPEVFDAAPNTETDVENASEPLEAAETPDEIQSVDTEITPDADAQAADAAQDDDSDVSEQNPAAQDEQAQPAQTAEESAPEQGAALAEQDEGESHDAPDENAAAETEPAPAPNKVKEWFRKHIILVVCIGVALLIGVGLTVGHFIATRNLAFIHDSADFEEALAEGKKTEFVFKTDITYSGDLILNGIGLDMNKHTLTVKGNLTMTGDAFVGYKKTIWSEPQAGGAVVVEGVYAQTGNIVWYSALQAPTVSVTGNLLIGNDFTTSSLLVGGALDVSGKLVADSVDVGGDLSVDGTVNAPVTLTENASIKGHVDSVSGGKRITVYGSVGKVDGAQSLYLYPDSDVSSFSVGAYYFVRYLEAPTVVVKKVENKQVLLISHVLDADGYTITVDGTDLTYDAACDKESDNTQFDLPDLDPGNYTFIVSPYSEQPEVYIGGAGAKIKVSYYVQLSTPEVSVAEVAKEDGTHVIVTIQKVDNAISYVLNVQGKKYTVNATDGETIYDITSDIGGVGSYDIYVYAKPPKKGNYQESETTLVTYVSKIIATASVTVSLADDGVNAVITGTNAYYYLVEWQQKGTTVSTEYVKAAADGVTVHTTLTAAEIDAVVVTPLGKGYYENGEAKSVAVPAADGATSDASPQTADQAETQSTDSAE